MKSSKFFFILLGFVAGISYMIACGSATPPIAVAEDIASTASVGELLVGNWSGTFYESGSSRSSTSVPTAPSSGDSSLSLSSFSSSGNTFEGNNLTLNSDGTFSCSGPGFDELEEDGFCSFPVRWDLFSRTINFIFNEAYSGDERQNLMLINFIDESKLELVSPGFAGVFVLTKS